jgi:hypothetical protein
MEPTTVPIGLAALEGDFSAIRRFAERDHREHCRWTTLESGGHFAAHSLTVATFVSDVEPEGQLIPTRARPVRLHG